MAALFAGLVPANQPAGSPLEIQPVLAATVFLSHNNQPILAKILPAERDQWCLTEKKNPSILSLPSVLPNPLFPIPHTKHEIIMPSIHPLN